VVPLELLVSREIKEPPGLMDKMARQVLQGPLDPPEQKGFLEIKE